MFHIGNTQGELVIYLHFSLSSSRFLHEIIVFSCRIYQYFLSFVFLKISIFLNFWRIFLLDVEFWLHSYLFFPFIKIQFPCFLAPVVLVRKGFAFLPLSILCLCACFTFLLCILVVLLLSVLAWFSLYFSFFKFLV